jgi:aspartate aminotransferase
MINEMYKDMTGKGSVIREFFTYANQKAAEIGADKIYNFSIGNPSVPVPQEFTDYVIELLKTREPVALHGYSPTLGLDSTRKAIADSLNRRFGMNYEAKHIFPTTGAAGAIAHAVRCVVKDGDEVLTFAPYFPEYVPYITGTGASLTVVPADIDTFQINFDEFEKALNPNVQAVLVNSPNNPSGIVYTTNTIKKLASVLEAKQKEYGHDIYLISDEPYREIVFAGTDAPFISKYYDNTICCYSFSKSVSLPGERIGYVQLILPARILSLSY